MDTTYLIEEYVNTKLGQAYKLFPFGKIVKNGKERNITPEFASKFKLPHFKPPIKLGSHDDTTPAGGHIVGLEVRADGLYAIPEWNDKGETSIQDGAYRYHSPEILFDGAIEDPQTGGMITAPLVLGDSLLHTPHLGEQTALYTVTGVTNMEENIQMPKSFWDKFIAPLLDKKPETLEVVKIPEDYEATKLERDNYKAELAKIQAEGQRKALVEKFETELKETKVGDGAMAELLADLPAEKSDAIMRQYKALSEQIKESALLGERGTDVTVTTDDPKAEFNAAVLAISKEKNINYNAAFEEAKSKHTDLFKSAFAK